MGLKNNLIWLGIGILLGLFVGYFIYYENPTFNTQLDFEKGLQLDDLYLCFNKDGWGRVEYQEYINNSNECSQLIGKVPPNNRQFVNKGNSLIIKTNKQQYKVDFIDIKEKQVGVQITILSKRKLNIFQ